MSRRPDGLAPGHFARRAAKRSFAVALDGTSLHPVAPNKQAARRARDAQRAVEDAGPYEKTCLPSSVLSSLVPWGIIQKGAEAPFLAVSMREVLRRGRIRNLPLLSRFLSPFLCRHKERGRRRHNPSRQTYNGPSRTPAPTNTPDPSILDSRFSNLESHIP